MPESTSAESTSGRVDYDAELRRLNEVFRGSYDLRAEHRVVDIGCGAGQTTRDAAQLASAGAVLGVDISAHMIERARLLSHDAGLHNITFEQADAQTYGFAAERFDVAISRFGTMFFADPLAAFTNIARAIRPGGRLLIMVWQEQWKNEWSVYIQRAVADGAGVPADSLGAPDPFSLGNRAETERLLEHAGFVDATFTDVREPVYYGADVASALEWVGGFSYIRELLQRLDPDSASRTRERLREMLAAHTREDGVWFDSRAWIIAARRP